MRHLIIGPPGTGKTQRGLRIVEEALAQGVHPTDILYSSFTRAAAHEARTRALDRFRHYSKDDFPYFRTMHSIAYRLIGLSRDRVFNSKKFAQQYGYMLSEEGDPESQEAPERMLQTDADYFMAFDEWRKNCLIKDLNAAYRQFIRQQPWLPEGWSKNRLLHFLERKAEYKKQHNFWEFADFLLWVYQNHVPLDTHLFLIDECQDLSPLLFAVASLWASQAKESYWIGDPNQVLYSFAGADPGLLINLERDQEEVLRQSYRCPVAVHQMARQVITRNRTRYPDDDFRPRKAPGQVVRMKPEQMRWHDLSGSVFYVHRTRWLLDRAREALIQAGVAFRTNRGRESPLQGRFGRAARVILRLAHLEYVSMEDLAATVKEISSKPWLKRGAKSEILGSAKGSSAKGNVEVNFRKLPDLGFTPDFMGCLDEERFLTPLSMPEADKAYLHRVFRHYGAVAFERDPQMLLSTQHGVKGMECDTVVINDAYTKLPALSLEQDPEPENRLAYVSLTRAREKVIILESDAKWVYQF